MIDMVFYNCRYRGKSIAGVPGRLKIVYAEWR
jgi:hypothetical protein